MSESSNKRIKRYPKEDYETYPLVVTLKDTEDRYGHKFKNDFTHIPYACMCCNRRIKSYIVQCHSCDYEYSFCNKCKKEANILFGFGICLFCEREKNDKIVKALNKLCDEEFKVDCNDFYGRKTIETLLEKNLSKQ